MKALKLALVALLLMSSGCTAVKLEAVRSAEGYKPIINLDNKPVMQELTQDEYAEFRKLNEGAREKINANIKALSLDSLKCRKLVGRYNNWAGTHNEITAKSLGLSRGGKEDGDDDDSRSGGD